MLTNRAPASCFKLRDRGVVHHAEILGIEGDTYRCREIAKSRPSGSEVWSGRFKFPRFYATANT